jgi:hypothetical protein
MTLDDLIDEEDAATVSYEWILRVRDLLDASKLVLESEGTYDLEHLEECINNLEEEET